ncbi:lysoplasmalogenase family protein [Agrococcus sp. DT81.2]|uniref:lysoplasmalogenase family protein n=1 Tax=Agrococcus sp. DT81.2 TaxID=3393414 RepID=UPI003CE5A7F6
MPTTPLPRPLRLGFWIAGCLLAVNLLAATLLALEVGDAGLLEQLRLVLMWALLPPIWIALIAIGALRRAVGRWHVAAAALCGLGDGLGAATDLTIVLLSLFLLGHIAYLVALWPTRRRSLAWGPGAIAYAIVGLISGGIIAIGAGPLAVPVLVFALVLVAVAAFAAIDVPGLLGGLLFMIGDLVLGLSLFVIEIPEPLASIVVLTAYAAAQALLAVSLQQRLRLGVGHETHASV